MRLRSSAAGVAAAVSTVALVGSALGTGTAASAGTALAGHDSGPHGFGHRPHGAIDVSSLSQGARAWFTGPLAGGGDEPPFKAGRVAFGTNVDANNPLRDLVPTQDESAIAAASSTNTVVVAWNDSTGFVVQPSTGPKASLTGLGVSTDGGRRFHDLIGLRNNRPNQQWFGDPTVVRIDSHHFAIGSLYLPPNRIDCRRGHHTSLDLAVEMLTVRPNGRTVLGEPVVTASGGDFCTAFTRHPAPDLAMLDKDWLSYDAHSRQLVMSYTRFYLGVHNQSGNGQIELVRAHVPAHPQLLRAGDWSNPIVVWPEERQVVNTGAYVSVAPNGAAYVAWERNVDSNQFNGNPYVYIHAARVPLGLARPSVGGPGNPRVVTKGQRNSGGAGGVKSMDLVAIPGYNRFYGQDFPRIAVDAPRHKVVVVWNDSSAHALGDIWLRALPMGLALNSRIHKVNDDHSSALHFLPAVSVRANGSLATSWYDRRMAGPDSARTQYFGEVRSSPRSNGRDFRISTGSTDWTNTSAIATPNFGDYTDSASSGSRTYYTWTDGRTGVPQPFVDSSR
ncbi:MAG: hypothetical protein QOD35_949 [Nocardioidaceae bacterium]|nr:hypothetical protein [Nocardioidaceae bacterium]